MTLSEFKAWFSGFTESMDSTPNEKQWARIKARVAEIDDKMTTYPVFVDRYRPYWINSNGWPSHGMRMLVGPMSTAGDVGMPPQNASEGTIGKNEFNQFFNSHSAMLDLGKAEYLAS